MTKNLELYNAKQHEANLRQNLSLLKKENLMQMLKLNETALVVYNEQKLNMTKNTLDIKTN